MYSLYVEMFGENICESIGNELQSCKYVSDCHGEFGYNSSTLLEHIKNSNVSAIFTTDMTYNYVSNYKVTRYFTEDENGSLKFWNYDFNRFFPTLARPSVVVIAKNKTLLSHLEDVIISEYANSHLAKVPHPILPNQKISLKLLISNKEHINHYYNQDEDTYSSTIYFDIVNLPWYFKDWNRTDVNNSHHLQKEALRQYFALCDLEEGCANVINNADENSEADTYRLNTIMRKKAALLDIMNIGKDMRDHKMLKKIAMMVNLQEISIQEAVNQLYSEIIAERQKELEKINAERKRMQAHYYEDDYDTQRGSILGSIIDGASEYRNEKKLEKQRLEYEREQKEYEKKREREKRDERHRRAIQSQREWEAVRKANEERRRKGQPELPLPPRDWY